MLVGVNLLPGTGLLWRWPLSEGGGLRMLCTHAYYVGTPFSSAIIIVCVVDSLINKVLSVVIGALRKIQSTLTRSKAF